MPKNKSTQQIISEQSQQIESLQIALNVQRRKREKAELIVHITHEVFLQFNHFKPSLANKACAWMLDHLVKNPSLINETSTVNEWAKFALDQIEEQKHG